MCGEKQSIKRHYGLGNGQECRKHVQKLNGIRGEMDETKSSQSISTDDENENTTNVTPIVQSLQNKPSKWSEYVEKSVENTETPKSDDDKMYLDDSEVVLEIPKKRRKICNKRFNRNQITKTCFDSVQSEENYVSSSTCVPKHGPTNFGSTQFGNVMKNKTFTPPVKKDTSLPSDFGIPAYSSKWAGLDNELVVNEPSNSEETEFSPLQTNANTRKTFVPPAINKNSKWAKFAEENENVEENESEESNLSQNNSQNDPHTLFSLCDDNELDDYLAI